MATRTMKGKNGIVAMLAVAFTAAANAEEQVVSPYAKGGEVSIVETATYKRYVHVFTNTAVVAQFRNKSNQTLRGRILVVGGGGAGGYGLNSASGGGGEGGGDEGLARTCDGKSRDRPLPERIPEIAIVARPLRTVASY